MRLPAARASGELEVKMTPMIDVVFLLLIFFVWTSSFETPEYDLPGAISKKPEGGSIANTDVPPPIEPYDEVIVRLRMRNGLVAIQIAGDEVSSFDELHERLEAIVALGVQPPVIIDPEGTVQMEQTVKAYDVARAAGADRVLYATSER
ncbi:biopolymer transporter ExbD [Stieleria sp. JC731]|uniref:ExbD/TolR family protein n=1 Tax=Pirellulaceae TaxID=2691357 RepID=UPI001E3F93C0|nr:biopolymer transporter ExbD [Stieleria sp. JC731]MCC9602803.1 biopolymer transporter ExbD [Stieleria sp. JC731]